MKTKNKKQTIVILGLILLLAIPVYAEEVTKPEDLVQVVELVKPRNNDKYNPDCLQGFTLCKTKIGDGANCGASSGIITDNILKFNLDEIPKEGNIEVKGGELITCRINGREIISINTGACDGEQTNTISRQDFKLGENKIECTVNNKHHSKNRHKRRGLTLSSFSFTIDNSHLIVEEQNTMLKTEAYEILEERSTSEWKKAKYAKKSVKYKEKLEKIKKKIKDKKKK